VSRNRRKLFNRRCFGQSGSSLEAIFGEKQVDRVRSRISAKEIRVIVCTGSSQDGLIIFLNDDDDDDDDSAGAR